MKTGPFSYEKWQEYLAKQNAQKKAAAEAQKKAANPYAYELMEQIKKTPASEFALKAATGETLWEEKHTNPLGSEYIPAAAYEKQQADLRKSLINSDAAKRYNDIILKKQKEYDTAFQQYADANVKTPLMAPNDFGALAADSFLRTRNLVKKSATQYETTNEWPTAALNNLYSLLENEGEEKALDYAKQVNTAIQNQEFRELGEKHPLLATIASVPLNLAGGYEHMFNAAEFVGEKLGGNKNAKLERSAGTDLASSLRQGVTDWGDLKIGDWDAFDFIYNTGMSVVDVYAASLVSGGDAVGSAVGNKIVQKLGSKFGAKLLGKMVGSIGASTVLGLQASSSAANDVLDRGGTSEQAMNAGVAAGVFETLFETFSLGEIKALGSTSKEYFKEMIKETGDASIKLMLKRMGIDIAKSGFINFTEEAATEIANILYDYFAHGDISNYALMVEEYVAQGMTEADARNKAAGDLALQVLESGASGFVMGSFMTTGETKHAYRAANVETFLSSLSNGIDYSFGITQNDIDQYVDNAYENSNTEDYKKYAEVSEKLSADLKDDIDISGYSHALRDNDIRHIRNSHGEKTNEKYPVTKEDIKRIPEIVSNYDAVFYFPKQSGEKGIVYVKVADNGLTYYLEQATSKYGNENLLVNKQMIKTGIGEIPNIKGLETAINKKKRTDEFLADLKARQVYAQSVYQQSSNDSIPILPENVNGNSQTFEELAAKEVFGDREYSIDIYSEEQYNNFGWVRHNNVLSAAEYSTLLSRYADYKHNKDNYPTTRFGEAVIFSFDYPNILMYVKGTIENPQITKILIIDSAIPSTIQCDIQREILSNERQGLSLPWKNATSIFGEESINFNKKRDFPSFQEYKRGREGSFGEKDYSFDRNERNGTRGTNKSEANNGQNKITVVNPDSQVQGIPMISEPDLTTQKPQSLEEIAMANITGKNPRDAEQRTVESIARILNKKVEWYENADVTDRGYHENGIIHINVKANQPYTVVFTHEFLHHLQNTKVYAKFTEFVMGTNSYKIWIAQNGGYDAFSQNIKTTYEAREGKPMSETRLRYEIMARFISEGFFTEADFREDVDGKGKAYSLFEEIAQNHQWYHRVMDWFAEMINRLKRRSVQADFIKMQRLLKAAYSKVQSRAAQVDSGREYDIITLDSGKSFVRASRKIISGNDVAEWRRQIRTFFNNALKNGPITIDTIEGDTLTISKDTAEKARDITFLENDIKRKLTRDGFLVKLHAESHIDELSEISTKNNNGKIVPDAKNHSFAKDGFTYRTVYFEDFDGAYYRITLSIGQNGNVSTVYNVGKIKADDIPNENIVSVIGSKADMSSTNHSIRDSAKNSKENFENREYSFDINENLPSKLLANDLIADTGSSYDCTVLAAEVEKIYAALDEGNKAAAYALANNVADNILSATENGENWGNSEVAGKDATERLANHIVERAQEAEEITLKKARNENQNLQKKVDGLKKEGGNSELDRKQIRAEEREKLEAAAQRRTDLNVIKRAVNRIDTKLRQNSNAKHVPKELSKAAIEFCSIFAQNDTSVFDSTKIWNVRKLYDALLKVQKKNGYGNADPDILEDIQYIGDVMQNRRLISLNKTERETVRRIAEHLEHLINKTNEIFIEEKKQEASEVADKEIKRLKKKPKKTYHNLGDGTLRKSVDRLKEFLHVGNKKPIFFFEEVGGLLEKLYKDISKGFDKAIFNLKECSEQLQGIIKKHDYKNWLKDKKAKHKATRGGLVLKKKDGQQITVAPEQVMSIYAIHLREEANQDTKGTNHLRQGGIVLTTREIIRKIEGYVKNSEKENSENTLDKMIKHGWFTAWADKPYRIDDNDIAQIKEYLGKDGMAFVEDMVHWLSTVGAQLGNEASMQLYNINKFGENYYFPIETSSDYLARQVFQKKGNKTLAGSSFTKTVSEKANSPIVVGNFLDICADHMIAMCAYNALTVPIDNFKRIWGYSAVGENGEAAVSLRNEIKRVFGEEYAKYIEQFIKDVDGGIDGQQPGDSLAADLIGKFKKNAVVAKLSVAIQQPSSLLRALPYIELKYLLSGKAITNVKETFEECMKYNSVAIQKEIGRFDVGNPKSARDYMLGTEYNGAKEKIDGFLHDENYRDDVLGKGPETMDKITWCIIWNGCKAKIEATTDFEVGSEQFFTEAAKLFKEVIEHTQVYDSVLSRSQNMRSHSRWTQIVTSFAGEATTNLNLLLKAFSEFKNGNKKFAGKIVGSIVASTFFNALLKSLVTAMRDDDEDKSYGEKYITDVGQNFWGDIWPHTWVPLISDAASIWEGYKIERADMSLVQDLYEGLNALDNDKKNTWDKILGIAAPLSSMTGVPVGNIARDIGNFVKTISHALNDDLSHTHGLKYAFEEGMWGERKFAEYYEIMRDKQKKGDTQGYTELKEYLMGRGKTEKEIESGVKAAYSKSKAVTNQADDYFAKLAQNALFGKLPDEKQEDVKTAVKRYLTDREMNDANGREMSKTNQKALEAEKKGSSAVNYFLAKASFEDTDNSGGISNEEKIAAINKMNISALEKQVLVMLYTSK